MILHIPHSSQTFPDGVVPTYPMLDSINRLTDWYVDELFYSNGSDRLVFPYSRLFCDVERLITDENAYNGQGIVYTKGWNGYPIEFNVGEWNRLEFYKAHHDKFKAMVHHQLSYIEKCVIVDCHSYSEAQLGDGIDEYECPDICIGTNERTTSRELEDLVANKFMELGYTVEVNFPYGNSILPWNEADDGLETIMIEINKSIYMDGKLKKSENFDKVKDDITKVLDVIKAYEFA